MSTMLALRSGKDSSQVPSISTAMAPALAANTLR